MSYNLIYALFVVHAPCTVTVIYRLCSQEIFRGGGFYFSHILCYTGREFFYVSSLCRYLLIWYRCSPLKMCIRDIDASSIMRLNMLQKLNHQIHNSSSFHLVNILWCNICNPCFNLREMVMMLALMFHLPHMVFKCCITRNSDLTQTTALFCISFVINPSIWFSEKKKTWQSFEIPTRWFNFLNNGLWRFLQFPQKLF